MSFCSQCGCDIDLRFCRRCGAPNVWSGVADSPNRVRISPEEAYRSLNMVSRFIFGTVGSWAQAVADQVVVVQTEVTSGNLTLAQLQAILQELQDELDSLNDLSDMASTELQMLMDLNNTLLQTFSNIEKCWSDTNMAIIGNIKQ